MIPLLKILLPVYLLLFFGLAMFWRSYLTWKRTGVNPYALGNGDDLHAFVGRLFRLTLLGAAVIVAAFSFFRPLYDLFVPIPWLASPRVAALGMVLLAAALAWVLAAQTQMGDSWRIGVDEDTASPLVQRGLFGVSRNPIFLGMLVMLAGLLLTVPTALTLAVSLLGAALIHVQVRLEEAFLAGKYGESYRAYRRRVRRWL